MNWFEKHLNWTAVCIFIIGLTGSFILCMLCTANYLFINCSDIMDTPIVNRLIVGALCFLLILFGIGWVLKKNNRSLWFLILSAISLLLSMPWIIFSVYFEVHHPFFLILVPSLLAGLFVIVFVIALKYSRYENTPVYRSTLITSPFSLSWYKNQYRLHKIPFISFSVVLIGLICFTTYSYFSMDYCYKTVNGWSTREIKYSFECPPCYYDEFWPWGHYCGDISITELFRQKWVSASPSSIQIRVWQTLGFYGSTENMTSQEKYYFAVSSSWAGLFENDAPVRDIKFSPTSVLDQPAERISLIIDERPEEFYSWGTLEAVCFEKYGYIWVLSIYYPGENEYQLSKQFDHLVESFEIHY